MSPVVRPTGAIVEDGCQQDVSGVCTLPGGERGPVNQYVLESEGRTTTACKRCAQYLFSTGDWELLDEGSGWEKQLDDAQLAIEEDPTDPDNFRRAAYVALHLNEFEQALNYDQQAVKLKPDFLRAWAGIVVAASLDGRIETASEAIQKVRELGSPGDYSDIETSFYYGQLLLKIDEVGKAEPLLTKVSNSKPDPSDMYMLRLRDRATTYLKALRSRESPYLETWMLESANEDDAQDALWRHLGAPQLWSSAAIRRLLGSDFQQDWRVEAGRWLLEAEMHGYADTVVQKAVKRAQRTPTKGRPEKKLFLEFLEEMSEGMGAYWFLRTGWAFDEWQPKVPNADVDFRLRAPDGTLVSFQVKAPDEHGEVINHKIRGGEYDSRIVTATEKACSQLPQPATSPALIVVIAKRNLPLTATPRVLERHLVGGTTQYAGTVGLYLHDDDRGLFFTPEWRHCSGVVMLHYVRGVDTFLYANVTLLNPNASHPCELDWFAGARVCYLEGDRFHWRGGKPKYSIIGEGTHLTNDRPW